MSRSGRGHSGTVPYIMKTGLSFTEREVLESRSDPGRLDWRTGSKASQRGPLNKTYRSKFETEGRESLTGRLD